MADHLFTVTIPDRYVEGLDPKRIGAYLEAQGFIVLSARLADPSTLSITVPDSASEQSIRSALQSFANQETPTEKLLNEAQADAWPLLKAIAAKPRGDRTNAEKLILGIAATVYEGRLATE